MIKMLDHTADVGFELGAPTLEALFEEAMRALLLVVFERPPGEGEEEVEIHLSAPDRETLLVRWLNELAYMIQDEGFVPVRTRVFITEAGGYSLQGSLTGAPLDLEGYGWQGEVKSATFHGLEITGGDDGWHARVILDV
jgi:SHS2 domain-containing protein